MVTGPPRVGQQKCSVRLMSSNESNEPRIQVKRSPAGEMSRICTVF